MDWKRVVIVGLLLTVQQSASTQTIHHIPFGSGGNTIELIIANNSSVTAFDLQVKLTNAPSWLRFSSKEQTLALKAQEELPVVFSFSVDKSAPVGQEQTLSFLITTKTGERRIKELKIAVETPEIFELFQNYPNPFNPTTTISFQLPVDSHVRLKIFNLLGQEVATLVEQERPAGYHQETFDAHNVASGIYVYQLVATAIDGTRMTARRAMVLVK